jgi:hypothetical protein
MGMGAETATEAGEDSGAGGGGGGSGGGGVSGEGSGGGAPKTRVLRCRQFLATNKRFFALALDVRHRSSLADRELVRGQHYQFDAPAAPTDRGPS